jgi:hypothetical protein
MSVREERRYFCHFNTDVGGVGHDGGFGLGWITSVVALPKIARGSLRTMMKELLRWSRAVLQNVVGCGVLLCRVKRQCYTVESGDCVRVRLRFERPGARVFLNAE